ncbi:unnamed protein product [Mytilus edulis]|uniref:BTB domain-containing protein n=1 Tax=Mytilus edulis TaxID=6550 RepID=A0A8S3SYZ3_MYTED|nr:unnamed protein product [Mytilus edulis]
MDESILAHRGRRLIAAYPEEVPLSPIRVPSPFNDSRSDSDDEVSTDSVEDLEKLTSREKNLASPFNEPNIALVFGTSKLFVQRNHLIDVSPVFEAMFSSKFLEGSLKEIPLPGKKLSHFVHFLRYLSPGFEDELTDTVHHMLPLADEYQTDGLKKRIEEFLINSVRSESDSITSLQIIINILEAEKYKLNDYLNECIAVASRKTFNRLTKSPKFDGISQNTQLKISMKRWEDIDKIYQKSIRDENPGLVSQRENKKELFHPRIQRSCPIYIKDVSKDLKPHMQNN